MPRHPIGFAGLAVAGSTLRVCACRKTIMSIWSCWGETDGVMHPISARRDEGTGRGRLPKICFDPGAYRLHGCRRKSKPDRLTHEHHV